MTAPSATASTGAIRRYGDNLRISSAPDKDDPLVIDRFQVMLQNVHIATESDGIAIYENFLKLLPRFSKSTLYRFRSLIDELVKRFPNLHKEQVDLCKALGKWHMAALSENQTAVQNLDKLTPTDLKTYPRVAIGYYSKAVRLSGNGEPAHYEDTHRLFLILIAEELKNAFAETYAAGEIESFKALIEGTSQLHNYCFDDDSKNIVETVYLTASGLLLSENPRPNWRPCSEINLVKLNELRAYNEMRLPFERHKGNLRAYRVLFNQSGDIRQLQRERFEKFRDLFFLPLLQDVFAIIGQPPPCSYSFVGLGSTAKEELRPFSDLEWLLLINDKKHKKYFDRVIRILDLFVLSLGEMSIKVGVTFPKLHPDEGFHLELPNVDEHIKKSVGIPNEIAGRLSELLSDTTLSMILKTVSLSNNDPTLLPRLQEHLKAHLETPLEENVTLRTRGALNQLQTRADDYANEWERVPLDQCDFDLKKGFIQLLPYALGDLAIYFGIEKINTLDIIDEFTGVFSTQTKTLLKWSVEKLYLKRIQSDLEPTEPHDLEILKQIYWVVIWPLYDLLKQIKQPEDIKYKLKNIDLIDHAFTLSASRDIATLKSAIPYIAITLCQLEATYDNHLKYYRKLAAIPCEKDGLRAPYLETLEKHASPHTDALSNEPNACGQRRSAVKRQRQLRNAISAISQSKTAQQDKRGISVKLRSSFGEGFLSPELVTILTNEKGLIRKCDSYSVHNVFSLKSPGLHFKQSPRQPFLEYAIHSLTSRIVGTVTPPVELVLFEVTISGEKKNLVYPVLVSETINGKTLKQLEIERRVPFWKDCDIAQWTKLLIATIITRPCDGLPSNYIVTDQNGVFSIDNDISLREPLTKWGVWKTIHFCSILFCLFPGDSLLDLQVLKEFTTLDVPTILKAWLEDVIAKANEWERLLEIKPFEGLRLQEGTVAYLELQLIHLQKYLNKHLDFPISIQQILEQLISLRMDQPTELWIGPYIADKYERSMDKPSFDERLKFVTSNESTTLMSSAGIKDSRQTVMASERTLGELGQEIYGERLYQESFLVTFKAMKGDHFVHAKLSEYDDIEQKNILRDVLSYVQRMETKPKAITLQSCSALNTDALKLLVHDQLEYLNIRYCNQITSGDVRVIQKICPNLKELYLCGCDNLESIRLDNTSPLVFDRLVILEAQSCQKLKNVLIDAPFLERLLLNNNPNLVKLNVLAFSTHTRINECRSLAANDITIPNVVALFGLVPQRWSKKSEIIFSLRKHVLLQLVKQEGWNSHKMENELETLKDDKDVVYAAIKQNGDLLRYVSSRLRQDEEVVLAAVHQTWEAFKYADESLKDREDFVLKIAKVNVWAIFCASERLRKNKDFMRKAQTRNDQIKHSLSDEEEFINSKIRFPVTIHEIKKDITLLEMADYEMTFEIVYNYPFAIQWMNKKFRKDKGFILDILLRSPEGLQFLHDRDIIYSVIKRNGWALYYANEVFRKDKEIVLTAVRQNARALQLASEELQQDEEVISAARSSNGSSIALSEQEFAPVVPVPPVSVHSVENQLDLETRAVTDSFMISSTLAEIFRSTYSVDDISRVIRPNVTEKLSNGREAVLAAIKQNGVALQNTTDEFKNDKEIVLAAVADYGCALQFASKELKEDRTVVLAAVSRIGEALQWASYEFRKDKEIVFAATKSDGWAFRFASKTLKNDKTFVLAILHQNPGAFRYVGVELKKDREVVLAAVTRNGRAIHYASRELKDDRAVVLAAVSQDGLALQFSGPNFMDDKAIVLTAILQNGKALQFASVKLQADQEFIAIANNARETDSFH